MPAKIVTLTDPVYSSPGKVLTRGSAVVSHTEMISHNTAVYDGKVHPGTSASVRKAEKIIRHIPLDEPRSLPNAVRSTE